MVRLLRPRICAVVLGSMLSAVACVGNIGGDTPPAELPPPDAQHAHDVARVRLLNAREYRRTVHDLVGLEVSPTFSHADEGTGYDTGAEGKVDENLFSAFVDEAERLAKDYVAGPITDDYPCFEMEVGADCLANIVEDLGRRAFRRPLTEDEQAGLVALYDDVSLASDDHRLAMESVVTRMLSSVHFLYRSELGKPEGKTSVLDPWERASLISYTITGTMPDETLFAAAARGELEGDAIAEQVRRLLDTPDGRTQMVRFVAQWLRLQPLSEMAEHPEDFPKLDDPALGASLHQEFADYVSRTLYDDDGSVADLLTGRQTRVDAATAELYGMSIEEEHELVSLPDDRQGILSLASVLSVHASVAEPGKDRPVIRGLLIKNQLLCEKVGLPEGIDIVAASQDLDVDNFDDLTTREQFEAIMNQDQACIDCHAQFMPFGFLFGNFDALGRHNVEKGDRPIDTRVEGIEVDGDPTTFDNHLDLIDMLASSPIVSACFAQNLVAYVAGTADGDALAELTARVLEKASAEQSVTELLETILTTPELYTRRWEETP